MQKIPRYQLTGGIEVNECFEGIINNLPFIKDILVTPMRVNLCEELVIRDVPEGEHNCYAIELLYDQQAATIAGEDLPPYEWLLDITEKKQAEILCTMLKVFINVNYSILTARN